MLIRLLFIWISVISCLSLRAQTERDSIIILFRLNESRIDPSFANNQSQLDKLHKLLFSSSPHTIDSLNIIGSTSPDGLPTFNQKLASKRANTLSDYIRSTYPKFNETSISIRHISYTWDKTIPYLQEDSLLPAKEKVLKIIHEEKSLPFKKQQDLKKLQDGLAYQHIASHHLTRYRYAYCLLYLSMTKEDREQQIAEKQQFTPTVKADSLSIRTHIPDSIIEKGRRWYLTTNLLYWALLAWNAGIEYTLDNHSTLSLTSACAWWSRLNRERVYRWMDAELAYHYYFHADKRHSGFFIGGYAQTGLFEMMFSKKNRKGETLAGGISGGYRWLLNDHLSLHAELGLGYAYTDYRYATYIDETLIYQGHKYHHYIGPTRAAISIVYDFNRRKR